MSARRYSVWGTRLDSRGVLDDEPRGDRAMDEVMSLGWRDRELSPAEGD